MNSVGPATGTEATDAKSRTLRKCAKPFAACLNSVIAALDAPAGAAVVTPTGESICRFGVAPCDAKADAVAPLHLQGEQVARLEMYGGEALQHRVAQVAPLLAQALQAMIDCEDRRRAVTSEALEGYRERAHLYRAAKELNRPHDPAQVAGILLHLLCRSGTRRRCGAVFIGPGDGGGPALLASHGPDAERVFTDLAAKPLFPALIRGTAAGILNNAVPEIGCLLSLPLVAHGAPVGTLVIVDSKRFPPWT